VIRSPPPKLGAVAHGHENRVDDLPAAVEVELVAPRAQPPELGERRQDVAPPAARSQHRVRPFVDDGVEAGGQHAEEVRRPGPSEVDGPDPAGHHDVSGGPRVRPGYAERARGVVAGARRDDPQRRAGVREHVDGEVDQAVPADDDQRVDPGAHRAAGQHPGVGGVGTLEQAHREPRVLEPGDRDGRGADRPPPTGGGVHEDRDLPHHRVTVATDVRAAARR
jgi:hypothetical protein